MASPPPQRFNRRGIVPPLVEARCRRAWTQ